MKNNPPTAERILSLLADLYADQMGVKVEYVVVEGDDDDVSISRPAG